MDRNSLISIDGWRIDASSYRITRDGVEKKLEPRSMELLLYFAEYPDRVISREEIEDNVWQGRVVGYDALSSTIARIRKAFGDTSKNSRVIETVPKAGYRLIAPVVVETADYESFGDMHQEGDFQRKLTAILYADVAEYSRLTGEDEDRTHRQLRENMKSISDTIVRFEGRVVHYAGDAVLADFATASAAMHCALEVQENITRINRHLPEAQQVLFRIGVNLGDVIVDGDEIYGDGVNVAARLESLANPGGVFISGTVFDAVGQKQKFVFEYQGEKTVKNIQQPVRTYAVHLKSSAPFPVPDLAPSLQQNSRSHPAWVSNPIFILGIVVILVGALVSSFLTFYQITPPPVEPIEGEIKPFKPDPSSIAILPFTNTSKDPGVIVYADGLTRDLITDLRNAEGLKLTPRHSSFRYKDTTKLLPDIAQELQVRYIVRGSLRQALDDIRVNVQLIDTTTDEEVWAKRFDDSFENIFDIQDEIILEILKFLKLKVTKKPKSKEGTTNFEAYDMFLQAEHRRLNRRGTKSDPRILKLYSIAIELDPQYVDAYTGLAREALFNWQLGDNEIMSMDGWRNQVYENAGKARALDPENAEALAILGLLQAAGGAHDAGIDSIESALLSNPDNPQLYADLATILSYGGRHDEALNSINRAIDRHARPPTTYFAERARINFFLENYGNALRDAENDQDVSDVKNFTLFILGALNKREAAQRLVKIRLELRPWENQDYYRTLFAYYRRAQDIELIVKSAAKAGIP